MWCTVVRCPMDRLRLSTGGVSRAVRCSAACRASPATVRLGPSERYLGGFTRGGPFDQPVATSESFASWTFTAPADTVIDGYTIYRRERSAFALRDDGQPFPFTSLVQWFDSANGTRPVGGCLPADHCTGNGTTSPEARFSNQNRVDRAADTARWLSISVRCFDTSVTYSPYPCSGGGSFSIYASRMRLRDLTAPKPTASPTGGMLDAGPVGGTRALRFAAEDAGGGLLRGVLLADGQPLADAPPDNIERSCAEPYTKRIPCPAKSSFTIEADTRRLTNGPHRIQVRVVDVSGNETVSDPVTVVV
jgi:hypothetical protein